MGICGNCKWWEERLGNGWGFCGRNDKSTKAYRRSVKKVMRKKDYVFAFHEEWYAKGCVCFGINFGCIYFAKKP